MARPKGFVRRDVVLKYCRQYKDMPSMTLARMIFSREKGLYHNIDCARSEIRRVRGKAGGATDIEDKSLFESKPRPYNPFHIIPAGIKELGEWEPLALPFKNILVLSDIHAPYHDKQALEIALHEGKRSKVDCVLINGDGIDFYMLSRFEKDPRRRDVAHELEVFKNILKAIKSYLKCPIYFKEGNHDDRFKLYMMAHAPALLGIQALSMDVLLNNDFIDGRATDNGLNVVMVGSKKIIKVDKLNIVHGHELGKGITAPINPARGLFMRGKECALQGHNHRTSQHTETTMNGDVIATWSSGCLCDLHPAYLPINNWNLGFTRVEQNRRGFLVHNKKIINGEVYS